jgi:hypothetical protein
VKIYWLIWFVITFPVAFLIPELAVLANGRPDLTLSAAIWKLEGVNAGAPITHWTAVHFLFTGVFLLLCVWLTGHFGWRLWA